MGITRVCSSGVDCNPLGVDQPRIPLDVLPSCIPLWVPLVSRAAVQSVSISPAVSTCNLGIYVSVVRVDVSLV